MVGFAVGVSGGADGSERSGIAKEGGDAGDGGFGGGGDSGGAGGFDHAEIASDQFRLECSSSGDGGTDLVVPAGFEGFEFLGDLP
jgi:hypothetical protein